MKIKNVLLTLLVMIALFFLDNIPIGIAFVFGEQNKLKKQDFSIFQGMIVTIAIFVILAIFIYWTKKRGFATWSLEGMRGKWRYVALGMLGCFVFSMIGGSLLIMGGEDNTANQVAVDEVMKSVPPVLMWLLAGFAAPIMEETIFRAGIMKGLFPNKKMLGLIVSSLMFGFVHSPTNLGSWLIYGGIGFSLAFVYIKSERLEVNVATHMLWNTMAIVLGYLQ
ncbi:hypothetical protein SAMN02745116_02105 [Pilibacter termitis]|uniref:CAAX prenyl protease 2/Lysostaphin resistance protein A-like domain-containing protein n=1 Tax=Pilibacter termitis TaxID=263852 RepID=A0A1T4QAJ1_9ENTE|nr:type II CAAX endopeptidase family protein [Pilibacter termitis]SKA00238.1 hypothetical protein SAMN02745116_02105 [Pilibacter termitis]